MAAIVPARRWGGGRKKARSVVRDWREKSFVVYS